MNNIKAFPSALLKPCLAPFFHFFVRPVIPFEALRRDATLVAIGNLTVPIALIDHLIALKSATGRSKDQIDIEELRKIQARERP